MITTWLKSAFKKRDIPTEGQTAHTIAKSTDHPGNKITPAKMRAIFEDAERGQISEQHQLYTDIEERDSAIAANLDTRKRALLTLDWTIKAPREATPAEDDLTNTVATYFYDMPLFEDVVTDLMDAVGHGFSALETHWRYDGKIWRHERIKHIDPSWFTVKDEQLLLKTNDKPEGEELWPMGWIVHIHKSRSVRLERAGLFRTLAWLYMFKHYSLFDFAEFLELYGMPIRIGKYPMGASKDEKRTLLRALAEIGRNAAGIMPQGMEVELVDVASNGKGDPFLQMISWCEKSAARLILGQTLTSGTDDKTNTNALGKVHNEVRRDLMVSDAKQVAQTITQQIILPWVQLNYPAADLSRIPYFEFDTRELEDLTTYADALPKLVGVGVKIPEAWARERLGIPDAIDDEPLLAAPAYAMPAALKQAALRASNDLEKEETGKKTPQNTVDEELDKALSDPEFAAQLAAPVQQVMEVIATAGSYEEASDALTALYPDLNTAKHQEYLERAFFLADLMGMDDAAS